MGRRGRRWRHSSVRDGRVMIDDAFLSTGRLGNVGSVRCLCGEGGGVFGTLLISTSRSR